ncbi:DegV family protein [[Clostridium] dakarense]|uniref:DegV family protein n=1 Tax=Faecalimicrobium dakarense TaxID=1301100 RepID=UPI0005A7DAC0|nr:DegV family protein [[Clostridium] dakarense]
MNKIKLVTDSSCDLPKEIIDKYNIDLIGLNVLFGEDSFVGGIDIDNETFYKKMNEQKELPKTSCPSPDRFIKSYECEEESVLVLTLTSKLSATYSTAVLAKDMFMKENGNKKIEVIDTASGSVGAGLLVIKAAELIEEGKNIDEIVEEIEKCKEEVVFYGALETLENAIKGGRISAIKGGIINALNFKVIIHITEGVVKPIDKARGEVRTLKKVLEYVDVNATNCERKRLSIGHANCLDKALKVKELIQENHKFKDIVISEVGSVMGTYTAQGAILVSIL